MCVLRNEARPEGPAFDPVSAALALALSLVLAAGAARWWGAGASPEPPAVGSTPPPVVWIDPTTARPQTAPGLAGKVVWLTFWSAGSPTAGADLAALEGVWLRLGSRPRFAMAALAVEAGALTQPQGPTAVGGRRVPTFVASPETRRAFGAEGPGLPLHVLIDADGRVGAVARAGGGATVDGLAEQAARWLDDLGSAGRTEFAARPVARPGQAVPAASSRARSAAAA